MPQKAKVRKKGGKQTDRQTDIHTHTHTHTRKHTQTHTDEYHHRRVTKKKTCSSKARQRSGSLIDVSMVGNRWTVVDGFSWVFSSCKDPWTCTEIVYIWDKDVSLLLPYLFPGLTRPLPTSPPCLSPSQSPVKSQVKMLPLWENAIPPLMCLLQGNVTPLWLLTPSTDVPLTCHPDYDSSPLWLVTTPPLPQCTVAAKYRPLWPNLSVLNFPESEIKLSSIQLRVHNFESLGTGKTCDKMCLDVQLHWALREMVEETKLKIERKKSRSNFFSPAHHCTCLLGKLECSANFSSLQCQDSLRCLECQAQRKALQKWECSGWGSLWAERLAFFQLKTGEPCYGSVLGGWNSDFRVYPSPDFWIRARKFRKTQSKEGSFSHNEMFAKEGRTTRIQKLGLGLSISESQASLRPDSTYRSIPSRNHRNP